MTAAVGAAGTPPLVLSTAEVYHIATLKDGVHMRKVILPAIAVVALSVLAGAACSSPPPEAGVEGDSAVLAGHPAALSGDSSSNSNGGDLAYSWQVTKSPEGSMAQIESPGSSNTNLTPDVPGVYEISLTVSEGGRDSSPSAFTVEAMPWFTEVTAAAGVPGGGEQNFKNGFGPGASWADYNGDGLPDLYAASAGNNMLYRSNGDGTFTDVAAEAGVLAPCNAYGVAWADYDNDGDQDLYVVCHSEDQGVTIHHEASEPNYLFRNNGDGSFTDVAAEAGVDNVAHGSGATWVDYDSDGLLDLYVANFGIYGDGEEGMGDRNVLYRNNGDGTFADVTDQAGVAGQHGPVRYRWAGGQLVKSGMTFESIWFDYDNDGDQDFIECNDQGVSPLYRNEGDGTFADVTEAAGMFVLGSCMGIDAADYDKDGHQDVYFTNYNENYLWQNNGDGTFTERGREAGVDDFNVGWATGFVDYDNDGYLDIYVTNGLVGVSKEDGGGGGKPRLEPNVLYHNNRDGTFSDVSVPSGFGNPGVGRGTAVADFDGDGWVDFYVVNADGDNALYRNELTGRNNWVMVTLEGGPGNRDGIGARVTFHTDEWTQIAEVRGGSGYLGGNARDIICGLGSMSEVREIEVAWPSGKVTRLQNVEANTALTIREAG